MQTKKVSEVYSFKTKGVHSNARYNQKYEHLHAYVNNACAYTNSNNFTVVDVPKGKHFRNDGITIGL
jgi:hypothetical protein